MSRQRMHLPDCESLNSRPGPQSACDCGHPIYPLRPSQAMVRRESRKGRSPRLMIVSKMQMTDDEKDLAGSALQFEADARDWVKRELAADERLSRRTGSGKDVWA